MFYVSFSSHLDIREDWHQCCGQFFCFWPVDRGQRQLENVLSRTGALDMLHKEVKEEKENTDQKIAMNWKIFHLNISSSQQAFRHNAMTVNWRICCLLEKASNLGWYWELKQWCWIMIWRLQWGVWRVETRLMILLLWQWRVMQVWLTCCKVVPD